MILLGKLTMFRGHFTPCRMTSIKNNVKLEREVKIITRFICRNLEIKWLSEQVKIQQE